MKHKWMKIGMAFLAVVFLAALIRFTVARVSDGKGPAQQAAGTGSAGPSDAKGTMEKAAGTVEDQAELKGISPQAEKAAQERAQKYENLAPFNPPPNSRKKRRRPKGRGATP